MFNAAGSLRYRSSSIHAVRGSGPRHWPQPPVDFSHLPAFATAGNLGRCLVAAQSPLACPPRATPLEPTHTCCRLAGLADGSFLPSSQTTVALPRSALPEAFPIYIVSRPQSGLLEQWIETTFQVVAILIGYWLAAFGRDDFYIKLVAGMKCRVERQKNLVAKSHCVLLRIGNSI